MEEEGKNREEKKKREPKIGGDRKREKINVFNVWEFV